MEKSREHIRHCLLYEYQLGQKPTQAATNICSAIEEEVVSHATAARWWKRFDKNDYSLQDEPHPGRPTEVNIDQLLALVENDPRQTTRCLASIIGCDHSTIVRHLNELGFHSLLGVWVPHDLTPVQKTHRLDICASLLSRKRHFAWLDDLITGDEKWVLYVNITRKRQWVGPRQQPTPTPKPEMHPKKVMLSVWWGARGIAHWELLPPNTTVTGEIYCAQLERLKAKLDADRPKRDKVFFLHDNARPHVAKSVRKKLMEFGWELLPHPAYSPDLAPSDYYLFRALSNSLRDIIFADRNELESYLDNFFSSQPVEFYREGVHSLPARWQRVIDSEGRYIID